MAKKNETKERNIERPILLFLILIVLLTGIVCVFITPKSDKEIWLQIGNKVTKGDVSYNIGDYYEYDETGNGEIKDVTDVKWRVLGADKNGKLLIMSASSVEEVTLGKTDNIEQTMTDFKNASEKFNSIAKKYAQNVEATDARSITLEDINKITKYNEIDMPQYNQKTTYYWGNSENPFTKTEDNDITNSNDTHANQLYWYNKDKEEWVISKRDINKNYSKLEEITTLKNERILYSNTYYDENFEAKNYLDTESQEFKMIFTEENGEKTNYWVDGKVINATDKYIGHGYNVVRGNELNYSNILYSTGKIYEITAGIRVVVAID